MLKYCIYCVSEPVWDSLKLIQLVTPGQILAKGVPAKIRGLLTVGNSLRSQQQEPYCMSMGRIKSAGVGLKLLEYPSWLRLDIWEIGSIATILKVIRV